MQQFETPKLNTFLFYVLYPAHVVALAGLVLFPFFFEFGWAQVLMLFIGWILLPGLGSAVTLHRIVSHRALELRRGLKPIMLWLASLCLQGSPLGWAAIHRGSHHRHSDTLKDAHSPIHGTWYSYHAWLYDWAKYFNPKYSIDLLKDPMHLFFAHNYIKIIAVSYLIIGLISWQVLLFVFIIPAVYSLHQESAVNLLCHLKGKGYRNFETKDDSNNRPIMAYIVWGQAWHNNHHAKAASYDFGTSVSGKKWEFDPCLLVVPLLATQASRQRIFEGRKNGMANSNNKS
jgi:stearoyl-CoA desaturase (delta-9 desaturase)